MQSTAGYQHETPETLNERQLGCDFHHSHIIWDGVHSVSKVYYFAKPKLIGATCG